jgi:hypothetical protein
VKLLSVESAVPLLSESSRMPAGRCPNAMVMMHIDPCTIAMNILEHFQIIVPDI